MYNFSGVFFRIWGVCGIILLLGIVCLVFEKPWSAGFKIRNCKTAVVLIVFALFMSAVYATRVIFPDVSSYTGEFVSTNRNSRVAPPLPVTNEYVFRRGIEKKKVFYLDVFSKKEIFPYKFETGQKYRIFYDEFTNVIVRVEIIE